MAAALVTVLVLVAACGGGEAKRATQGGKTTSKADVTVTAEDINFPTKQFTAHAGNVTIRYVDEGKLAHTLVMEGVPGWKKLEVNGKGDAVTGTVMLAPGVYTMFCDVPGHRAAGMQATLSVG
jgi:plastocyanin